MEHRISATDLARRLGDVLGQIRYLGDSFVVERNGEPVARLAWQEAAESEAGFAEALERVGAADRLPGDPWGS
ncbi:MAG: type II toxin-antitoxin system Phd/YefM family antitoxin [Gemmatimonadota bacterium]